MGTTEGVLKSMSTSLVCIFHAKLNKDVHFELTSDEKAEQAAYAAQNQPQEMIELIFHTFNVWAFSKPFRWSNRFRMDRA